MRAPREPAHPAPLRPRGHRRGPLTAISHVLPTSAGGTQPPPAFHRAPGPEQPSAPPLLWAGLGATLATGTPRSPHVCWFRAVGPSGPWRRFVSPGGCPSARALRLFLYRCPGSRHVAGPAHP